MTTLSPILESLLHEFPGIAYRCLNDERWTVQYVSSGVKALTGFTAEAFVGHQGLTYADLVFVDDRERVRQEIDSALDAGTGFDLTYRIVTAQGSIKSVNEHGNAIRNDDGRIVALQGFVTDVTTAQQTQQALAEVTQRFSWIAQATNDNLWDCDLQANEIWFGPNTRGIFDFPSDVTTAASERWLNLIHPEDRERVGASINAAIAGTDRDWSAEYRLQRKDRSYVEVLSRGSIIRDVRNTAVRMVGGISDLTERKQSKLHLERLNRTLRILTLYNERLVRADDEPSLLSDICQVVVEEGGYQAASVSFIDDDAHGPFPAAVASGSNGQVVCGDIANDPLMADVREQLLSRGHRSGVWLPLAHGCQRLGVLAIYSGAVAPFDAEELQLLRALADNIAFGIVNMRSREDRNRIESAAVKIVAGVSANTGEAFFDQLAQNMASAVGAEGAFVARFQDDDLRSARTVSAVVSNAAIPNFAYEIAGSPCEALITSNGCVVLNDLTACFPSSGAVQMGMHGYAGCRLDSVAGQPLGLLFVLFRGQVAQPDFVARTMQIFAARAGAELERQLSDARILEQASLLDKAKDAIVVHDASHCVTFWNKGAERLYGLTAAQVLGTPVTEVVYGDEDRFQAISMSLAERDEWQGEMTWQRGDGIELALEINSTLMRDAWGRPGSVLSIVTDVTRRKAAEHEVAKLAFYDRLTGLPNRHFMEKQLQDFLDGALTAGHQGALLWIDLDRLKNLNDTRGHDMGDLLLRHTGERIRASIGSRDIAARFGGDEFVVLITELGNEPERAIAVATNLLQRLNEPFDLDGHTHSSSASIGLAYFRCGQDAATEILKRADIAMYEAKAAGRNTLRLFDTQMQKCAESRAELENDLRWALQRDALHLAYQPQMSDTGQVTGVEALLRWNHPTRGPISPTEFIPIAETSGLIILCGEWVLNQACMQLRRWENDALARSLSIAVNVSAHELRHPGFADRVTDVLRRTGADPRKLKLELTESSLVTDTDATVEKMKALKAIGISFSLDDFGTGFSSLSYLRRLPLDQLKIDRSFVSDVVKDTNAAVITRSVIALGQSLSLEVIAEGVETECQRQFLAMHGCGIYQGYLFSRPLGIEALEGYLLQTSNRCASAA